MRDFEYMKRLIFYIDKTEKENIKKCSEQLDKDPIWVGFKNKVKDNEERG